MNKLNPRIFIGMIEICGYYYNLAEGLRAQNYDVTLVTSEHEFKYRQTNSDDPAIVRLYNRIRKLRIDTPRTKLIKKLFVLFFYYIVLFFFAIWAIFKHDIFIFSFGTSIFFNNFDLRILKLFNKKIISNISHGSEARPTYINGAKFHSDGTPLDIDKLYGMTKKLKLKLNYIEKYSDVVIAHPLTSQFLYKKCINRFHLGFPLRLKSKQYTDTKNEVINILHCPSKPVCKGSVEIRKIIKSLIKKGYVINFVEITDQPNKIVLEAIAKCDFVIDQLYSDKPFPAISCEASRLSKPIIISGYGWDELKKYLPDEFYFPDNICHPNQIEKAIENLIIDKALRKDLGIKAYQFFEGFWGYDQFIERFISIIENDIPETWLFDPLDVKYVEGVGIKSDVLKLQLKRLVEKYGEQSLLLCDKPKLKNEFLRFIETS